jgi:hypothetical protein
MRMCAAPIVAELCRSALEAACHRVVWRVRSGRGDKYADIEAALNQAKRTTPVFALALFDNAEKGGEVAARLRQNHGFGPRTRTTPAVRAFTGSIAATCPVSSRTLGLSPGR